MQAAAGRASAPEERAGEGGGDGEHDPRVAAREFGDAVFPAVEVAFAAVAVHDRGAGLVDDALLI